MRRVQLLRMCCQVWRYDPEASLVRSSVLFCSVLPPPPTNTLVFTHSRHCGRLLCHKCSIKEIPIIKFDLNKPVRVCDICFDVLTLGGVS